MPDNPKVLASLILVPETHGCSKSEEFRGAYGTKDCVLAFSLVPQVQFLAFWIIDIVELSDTSKLLKEWTVITLLV